MAGVFPNLVKALQRLNPAVTGEGHAEWGMARASIRASLAHRLSGLSDSERKMCSDLSEPPRLVDWSVSISHATAFGGWLAVPRPAQIGWDVELRSRIQSKIIERVCSAEEIEMAPKQEYLWCAKESLFKALEDFQPAAITQLTVLNWQADKVNNLWTWTGIGPHNCRGLLLDGGELLVAGCLVD